MMNKYIFFFIGRDRTIIAILSCETGHVLLWQTALRKDLYKTEDYDLSNERIEWSARKDDDSQTRVCVSYSPPDLHPSHVCFMLAVQGTAYIYQNANHKLKIESVMRQGEVFTGEQACDSVDDLVNGLLPFGLEKAWQCTLPHDIASAVLCDFRSHQLSG